jgi:hypothetical protein
MKDKIKQILNEGDFDWTGNAESPLNIGEPKKPVERKNTVIVTVEWMSGDADAFNKEHYSFELDDTNEYNQFITFMKGIKYNQSNEFGYAHEWGEWREAMKRKFTDDEVDMIRDLWEYDVTGGDGDYSASPDEVSFRYFDPSGVERIVSLDWDKINIDG